MSTILAKMAVQIAANTSEFSKGLNQASTSLSKFKTDVTSVAVALASAFSVREVGQFILEMNKLAGTFEGVQRAFDRLPNSTLLMEKLKESTHGTVDELMLMQQALRARNFGISVKDLGTYLEFAAIRAQQTGESIDYMVNSIILGLGRGSIKILDNLQVNISKIKETVKETGVSLQEAFRQQVVEQMKVIGGYAETAATEVDRLSVAFKGMRLEAAKFLENKGLVKFFTDAADAIRVYIKAGGDLNNMKFVTILEQVEKDAVKRTKTFTDSLKGNLNEQAEAVKQQTYTLVRLIDKRNAELNRLNEEAAKNEERLKNQAGVLFSEDDLANRLNPSKNLLTKEEVERQNSQRQSMQANLRVMEREIVLLREYYDNLIKGAGASDKFVDNLDFMKQELELLNDEFEKMDVNDKKSLATKGQEILALQAQIAEIEKLKQAKKGLKMEFIFDAEAEGSTNPDLVNQREANKAQKLATDIAAIGKSAEFAGGALITLAEPLNEFKNVAKETIDISGLVAGGIMDIASAFGAAATGSVNFGDAILRSFASFAQQFGALLIASGVAKIAFDKFKGPAMIAAGAALVAIGGSVRSAISNRPSLDGGAGSSSGSIGRGFSQYAQNSTVGQMSLETVIRGQDLYVVLSNYERNNRSTRNG